MDRPNPCNLMRPIGFVSSLFTYKNGTPRQPSLCETARGTVTISKEIFNCPEHSLQGLEQYSHIWIIFIFHKNNNQYTKAKVKPPRLDGKRVGLFSTRSPYRPNPIGLTLAKLERVDGAKLHISGIDILDGSPVLDIKPYIPDYDCPTQPIKILSSIKACCGSNGQAQQDTRQPKHEGHQDQESESSSSCVPCELSCGSLLNTSGTESDYDVKNHIPVHELKAAKSYQLEVASHETENINHEKMSSGIHEIPIVNCQTVHNSQPSLSGGVDIEDKMQNKKFEASYMENLTEEQQIKTAEWISDPPVNRLLVRFTEMAKEQMKSFSNSSKDTNFRLNYLNSPKEVQETICQILQEDPRSIYRRQNCCDSLYYFVVDTVHVTCWFDDNITEVVRIKPVSQVKCLQSLP